MRTSCLAGLLLVCASSLLSQGRGDQPTFRTGVELIQLDVSVLDGRRQPVRGLTASDFTVLENGTPRPIRAFSAVELPVRAIAASGNVGAPKWTSTVAPDVRTNQVADEDGRLVIILMDRSIPREQPMVTARKIAIAAVEALGPNDLGALISTSGGVPQNLTNDRDRLMKAINQRDWATDSDEFPWRMVTTTEVDSALNDGRCLCGLCVLETVTRVADAVRDAPRKRKLLLFIGAGLFLQSGPPLTGTSSIVGCESRLRDARQAMFNSLSLSNLTIHSIDPRGLVNLGPQTQARIGGGFDRPVASGPQNRLQAQRDETTELLTTQEALQTLPDRTGGRAVMNTNGPEEIVPEILRESESYYVIGFEPSAPGAADDRRSIEVKTTRKNVRVSAQRQYIASTARLAVSAATRAGTMPLPISAALSGLLPAATTPLKIALGAFASPAGESASVRIYLDAGAFIRDQSQVPLELHVSALDQTGRQVGSARQSSTIVADGRSGSRLPIANIQTHLDLAPGDYEIRAALADARDGRAASVFSQIAVPNFARAPLSLSDLAIETVEAARPPPAQGNAQPLVPTTQRVFGRGQRVRAFFQIYQGTQVTDSLAPVTVRVTVVDAKGNAVRDQSLAIAEEDFQNRRTDCRINVPVDRLTAGEYLLKIQAAAAKHTADRALRFAVE
jgi:VWFA-related protein